MLLFAAFIGTFAYCFDCGLGIYGRIEFKTYEVLVAESVEVLEEVFVVDGSGAGFVASRCVGDVDMTDIGQVFFCDFTDFAFIEVHMVSVVKDFEVGGIDCFYEVCGVGCVVEEVAFVVFFDVECFQYEGDACCFCQGRDFFKDFVHCQETGQFGVVAAHGLGELRAVE